MKCQNFLPAVLATALCWGPLPAGGIVIYQSIRIDFRNGSLAERRFDGYLSYDDRNLTRTGTEYLLNLDSLYDESRPMGPNEYEGFDGFGVSIDGTGFGSSNRFEWSGPPSLRFDDGVLSGLSYFGLVVDQEERVDRVLHIGGSFGTGSTYFLQQNLATGEMDHSNGTITLVSDDEGPGSRLANQLRLHNASYSYWNWISNRTAFSTPYAEFVRNDDGIALDEVTRILVESVSGNTELLNSFGLIGSDGDFVSLLTNRDLRKSVTIDLPAVGAGSMAFAVDQGSGNPTLVSLLNTTNLRTFVSTNTDQTFVLWMLDDTIGGGESVYRDFNDFIILATLNAVPEPVWVISILSLVLIATVLWRHRLTAVRQT